MSTCVGGDLGIVTEEIGAPSKTCEVDLEIALGF